MTHRPEPSEKLIRLSDVLTHYVPISKSNWYRGVHQGKFPKPIKFGPRISFYRLSEIKALVDAFDEGKANAT